MSQLSPTCGVLGILSPSQNLGKVQLSSAQATGAWGGLPTFIGGRWWKVGSMGLFHHQTYMEKNRWGLGCNPPSKLWLGHPRCVLGCVFHGVPVVSKQLQFCDGLKAAFDQRRRGKVGNQCVPGSGVAAVLVACVDFRSFMSLGIRSSKPKISWGSGCHLQNRGGFFSPPETSPEWKKPNQRTEAR